jgi:glycosyltransferase involved in cell wall biosynthesis
MSNRRLSLVIPVYFNVESLPALSTELERVEGELQRRSLDLELIFVNDGSGDGSLQELLKIKDKRPPTKIINLSRNFGAVAASKTGLGFVTGDVFGILAADLQDPPQQVVEMADHWLAGHKFVISVRAARDDPWVSRLLSRLYYRAIDWLVVPGYPTGGYDLMLMDQSMLGHLIGSTKHTNLALYAFWLGFNPVVLYYVRRKREHGKSRYTFRKRFKFLVDTISGFSATPIRLMSLFGFSIAILSFVYGANIIVNALLGNVDLRGFATLVALISFFSGLILFMLGMLGEYLWRVFAAVNNVPEAVIDETYL